MSFIKEELSSDGNKTLVKPYPYVYCRDRGGGGAGRAAAPPLFCAPAPTFCAKRKIIKIKKKLETSFFRLYSAIFSVL